jgi:hypothetical protein
LRSSIFNEDSWAELNYDKLKLIHFFDPFFRNMRQPRYKNFKSSCRKIAFILNIILKTWFNHNEIGKLCNESWAYKKKVINNSYIDQIVEDCEF